MSIPGAIRWDAWYGKSGIAGDSESWVPAAVESTLGPKRFQFRMPWFGVPSSQYAVSINGGTQAIMDAEITYAAAAGVKYWAYCWYEPSNSSLMKAWALHQSSTIKNNVNWCMMLQESRANTSAYWTAHIPTWVSYFQQSNYQTVLSGRPVFYLFCDTVPFSGCAASVTALRAATIAAGLKTPYIVVLYGNPPTSASIMSTIGADAISDYQPKAGQSTTASNTDWPTAEAGMEAYWDAMRAAAPTGVVPICQTGWDTRPRHFLGTKLTNGRAHVGEAVYVTMPTQTQLTAHFQAAATYVNTTYPTACPSGLILIYSWDECDEGGNALIPSYSAGGPVTTALNAFSAVTW